MFEPLGQLRQKLPVTLPIVYHTRGLAGVTFQDTAGDAFLDRAQGCVRRLAQTQGIGNRVSVEDNRIFTGLNAYQQVLQHCDLVLLATPPGFRPSHLDASRSALAFMHPY